MGPTDETVPSGLRTRARAATSNATGRYETCSRTNFDDGWEMAEDERLLRTEVTFERPRSAISYNRSPDLPFDRSINPYRGCEHGCIYCFARPTHAYLNLSAGLDFETRLIARPGIAAVLEQELRAKSYAPRTIALGTNTDPYQPIEAAHLLMRQILEVLSVHNHPTAIVTKGAMIERDIDILAPMAAKGLLRVGISLTTLDDTLARRLEPRAAAPRRRLAVIRRLADAGIPVRVMMSPIIPGLTDHEIDPLLGAAAKAGATAANWAMLRLPLEVAPLFREWLGLHYPDRAAKVMGRIRDTHGGKDYDPEWGRRMRGQGIWSDTIRAQFDLAMRRHGLDLHHPPMRLDLFRPPPRAGDQLSLF
ncbi:PA0069 family radical SAM protein [Falsirhodobacter sp. alg1]|uniref:PA0069 family radical SAM protein n=1 Tax=Falsirhodobacter sp. alg1 TaxID=1472418 RepID=UPI0007871408|nr:PA0069 family radical SAM protein [Falsirhodobacter sp. alg1]